MGYVENKPIDLNLSTDSKIETTEVLEQKDVRRLSLRMLMYEYSASVIKLPYSAK